jgi:hypothetical protein
MHLAHVEFRQISLRGLTTMDTEDPGFALEKLDI